MDQTLELIREYLEGNATKLILTADSNGVVSAEKDENYARIFREAALITPDSNGPVWALRKLGHEIPDRVSGVELVERLCALSEELGFSIFFLGAAPGIAAMAAKNLKDKYTPPCQLIEENGEILKLKIESVAIKKVSPNATELILVSDSDGEKSELIFCGT